jgi:hypothetical protein
MRNALALSPDGKWLTTPWIDFSDPNCSRRVAGNTSWPLVQGTTFLNGGLIMASAGGTLVTLSGLAYFKSISRGVAGMRLEWEGWGQATLEGTASLTAPDWQDLGIPETTSNVS